MIPRIRIESIGIISLIAAPIGLIVLHPIETQASNDFFNLGPITQAPIEL